MSSSTNYLARYSWPLYFWDEAMKAMQPLATAIAISSGGCALLITAAHVHEIELPIYYPTGDKDGEGYEVCCEQGRTLSAFTDDGEIDRYDFTVIQIPIENLSPHKRFVPLQMIGRSFLLRHVDRIWLAGYPLTANDIRYKQKEHSPESWAIDLPQVHLDEYEQLGLDPIRQFCVRFDPKRMIHESGQKAKPPHLRGISGGPAWHIPEIAESTRTDEGVSLLGITTYQCNERKIIWGTRLSYIMLHLKEEYSEFLDAWRPLKHRTTDETEIRLWNKYAQRY